MTEVIKGITEEASIAIDKLLLEGKKIPAIRLYRIIRECTIGVAKDKMEARQVYLCDIGLAVMVKDRRYCDATTDGKAWLVEHKELPDDIEEEFVNIEGYKIKVFSSFPPDANPFHHDVMRMGVSLGDNLMGMMINHASSPCEALVLVDKPTGKRICIIPPSEDK